MDFYSLYTPSRYFTNALSGELTLSEILEGDSFTVDVHNAENSVLTEAISLSLPDSTYEVTWPGQTALSTQAELNANQLTVGAYNTVTVTVTFLSPGRTQEQQASFEWGGVAMTVYYTRNLMLFEEPEGGVEELMEFKTDVSEAWDGTEKRTRIRANPRTTYTFEYTVADRQQGVSFQAKMMGLPGRKARIGLWHRTQLFSSVTVDIDGNLLITASGGLDPSFFALSPGDRVWYYDNVTGEIFSHGLGYTLSGGTIALPPTPPSTPGFPIFFNASRYTLLPTAEVFMQERPSVGLFPSGATRYSVEWVEPNSSTFYQNERDNSTAWQDLCNSESYLSRPVLREGQYISGSLRFSSDSGSVWFDQSIGTIDTLNRRDSSAVSFERQFDYTFESNKVHSLRKFLHWTWGRQRSFWVPSTANDLFISTAAANGLSATFLGDDMGLLTPLLDGYSHLEADFGNGTRKQAQVIGQDSDGTNVTLTFDDVFVTDTDLASHPNMTISILYHVRLASDKIKINYDGPEEVSCRVNLVTVKQ